MKTLGSAMEYTNRYNLPKEIEAAIVKDRYTDENDVPSFASATKLIAPYRMTLLRQRHPDKMYVPDLMDMYWQFRGSVAHQVLEDSWNASMGSKVEERLYLPVEVSGRTYNISGKFDCYHDGEIRDYKFTKCYKVQKQDYTEWAQQLNIYAEILEHNGYPVNRLTIFAFLDDWKQPETYKKNYPDRPIFEIPVPLWSKERRQQFIYERVNGLLEADAFKDEMLPLCTSKEMWQDVKDWAIVKKGAARATKCFDVEQEAIDEFYHSNKYGNEYTLEKRLTPRTRCLKYCPARLVCSQAADVIDQSNDTEALF